MRKILNKLYFELEKAHGAKTPYVQFCFWVYGGFYYINPDGTEPTKWQTAIVTGVWVNILVVFILPNVVQIALIIGIRSGML